MTAMAEAPNSEYLQPHEAKRLARATESMNYGSNVFRIETVRKVNSGARGAGRLGNTITFKEVVPVRMQLLACERIG